jgi:hypothetical protein
VAEALALVDQDSGIAYRGIASKRTVGGACQAMKAGSR